MDNEKYTKEDLRELQIEKARRMKEEKYRFYEPTGKGEEFIDLFGNGDCFIVLWSAGNGIGKTATGANVLAHMFWESENPYFQSKYFTDFPYKKQGRIVTDPATIEKNIIPELENWFPKGRYKARKATKSFLSQWKTDTGWSFDIMSYEQHPKEFEGVTLGWAWFDEPPPESILKATVARMRKGGVIFITATPLAGSAYLYDQFAKGNTKVEFINAQGVKMVYERKVGYVEADIESACRTHGVRGHLKHEDIMNLIAEYDEDERQARIYGKFQHLVGLIFKKWNRKVHVIPPFHVKHRDFCVYEMLDPHPRNPDAVLWVAIDRNGTKYVVDELYVGVDSTEELAEKIKTKASQFRIVKRLADPSAFVINQHDNDGKSLADRLSTFGLTYQEATKQRTQADQRIKDALNYIEVNGHMIKAPEFYVFNTCERTIFEMEHYRWQEWTGRSADNKNRKEKPVDKDDHMIEDLGRCLIQEPSFIPYVPPVQSQQSEPNYDPYA